jgi:dihydropteroate synthase
VKLRCRDHVIALDRVAIMGVLNVTPDSFSDGGLYFDSDRAVTHGREMAERGAAIVDVGGESTRPGAAPVPEDEELHRVLPVIESLAGSGIVVSIDTRKPAVARRALEAGAAIVNDTLGEETNREIDGVVSESGAGVVVMHSRGTPATMSALTEYRDVVGEVCSFLEARARELEDAGVSQDAIVVDPGIGFAKNPDQSLLLLKRIDEVVALGRPVLVGTSRKSFIGKVLGLDEKERLEGTAATVSWVVGRGVQLVRVHDVPEMERVVRMTEAIRDA